jgi:hypothetical protein
MDTTEPTGPGFHAGLRLALLLVAPFWGGVIALVTGVI